MSASEHTTSNSFYTRLKLNTFEKRIIASTIILLILNIIDAELTLWGIQRQLIEEGNPLMQLFVEKNPLYLRLVKLLFPIFLGAACWRTRDKSQNLITYGMGLVLVVYLFVMFLHAQWIYCYLTM